MQDDHAIKELLNAKEGEQVQFKEAKNRFDSSEASPHLLCSVKLRRREACIWNIG